MTIPQTREQTRLLTASEAKVASIEARHRQANMQATAMDLARERELSQLHTELQTHQETIAGLREKAADYDRQAFAKTILESRLAEANQALVLSESRLSEVTQEATSAHRSLALLVQSYSNLNP